MCCPGEFGRAQRTILRLREGGHITYVNIECSSVRNVGRRWMTLIKHTFVTPHPASFSICLHVDSVF